MSSRMAERMAAIASSCSASFLSSRASSSVKRRASSLLDVDNRSTQTIYIQGKGAETWPDFAITECKTFDYSAGASDGNVIVDGLPSSIKLSPGARLHKHSTKAI